MNHYTTRVYQVEGVVIEAENLHRYGEALDALVDPFYSRMKEETARDIARELLADLDNRDNGQWLNVAEPVECGECSAPASIISEGQFAYCADCFTIEHARSMMGHNARGDVVERALLKAIGA